MIKKFLRESNIISLPNYSHFFTSIVNFFGYHFDRNEKDGNDYHNEKISKRFNDKWNDFFDPLIYLNSPKNYTLSLALRSSLDVSATIAWNELMAMSVVSMIPPVIIYVFAQKYFIEGIATTGLKG